MQKAHYHLPGLFEFYEFYKVFLPLYYEHTEFFYDWCDIGSIYGAPSGCAWGGGRLGDGDYRIQNKVLELAQKYNISCRLTFSNSLLQNEHLEDKECNDLCHLFHNKSNGIILHSDLLLNYLKEKYPLYYFVSSTTKVLTDFADFHSEVKRSDFHYVVPDFRLNKQFELFSHLSFEEKQKVEFLCNECCWFYCPSRKLCYQNVSARVLGLDCNQWICSAPDGKDGYVFSKAMKNPGFIGIDDIKNKYLPMGFSNFKIEGRSLGTGLILEFLLYYMTKPEYQLQVRENIYLDNTLDLF